MRIFFLLIIFSHSYNSYSQTSFRKGYIITIENDTVSGFINYKGGDGNYFQCRFKKSEDGEVREYNPQNIHGYKFLEDKLFLSKIIDNPAGEFQKVFLEVLVHGELTLYRFDDYRFFINKEDTTLHELVNDKELKKIEGKNVLVESNEHRGLLIYYMSDCRDFSKKASNIRLDERELTEFVEDYNKCREVPTISYKGDKPWFKFSLGLVSAYNRAKVDFFQTNSYLYYLNYSSFTTSSVIPGIHLEFNSPRLNEEGIAAIMQIMYNSSNSNMFFVKTYYSSTTRINLSVKIREVKIPVGFKYTFHGKKIDPYVNIGLFYSRNINSSAWLTVEQESPDNFSTYEFEPFFLSDDQLNTWFGIGVKKTIASRYYLFLELRYDRYNELIKYDPRHSNKYAASRVQNFQILAGFTLF